MLTYRRFNPSDPADLTECQWVFRMAPSFVYPTGGRPATDEEVAEMLGRVPGQLSADEMYAYSISNGTDLIGCYVLVRGYPDVQTAYLALLLIIDSAQGQSLGRAVLRRIEEEARGWRCAAISAAVDSMNERAFRFWLREGFMEEFRKAVPGFMGEAIGISKQVRTNPGKP
ncbi:GNAT family N-acetyltransferase [Ramlibacter sp. WS9]|uniref:GNAT family N-acetyltransferase n=1 Tax=Ramlibacter sp. WS9 TaxID=1882741 RepID=UPI001143E5B4|nr:GNAT family N-acetyltransferase [Ramlibacter sp. WS9]ROZ75686.1 GNAT family N-acetyltransferase [Ramlibacter sp. WS9]